MTTVKRYLPYLLIMMLMAAAFQPALADAAMPRNHVDIDDSVNTIWVLGDLEPVARALQWSALLFNSNTGSFALGMAQVALIFSGLIFMWSLATSGQFATTKNMLLVVIFVILLGPTTSVRVANAYDDGLDNAGAVRFKQVDNVPLMLGSALGTFSSLSHGLTQKINSVTQTIPDVNWTGNSTAASVGVLSGGMNLYGYQGVWSPLKTLLGLRSAFAKGGDPLITANMAIAARDCHQWRTRWKDTTEKGGFLAALTDAKQAGETGIWVAGNNGQRILTQMNCADAGKIIAAQALAQATPKPGETASSAARTLAVSQTISVTGKSAAGTPTAARVQNEMEELPKNIATAAGGASAGENPHTALDFAFQRANAQGGRFKPNEMAQFFSAGVAVDAASVQASLMMNEIAQKCIGELDSSCEKATLMLGEAMKSSAVDAAGEASAWSNTYEKFYNYMLLFFILFSVIMVPVIIVSGIKSWRHLAAYLMFLGWLFSIPPVQAGIANAVQSSLADKIYNLVMEQVASGNPAVLLTHAFSVRVFDEINTMMLQGSVLMSGVSALSMFLLTASPYVMSGLTNKANLVDKNDINETTEAPQLDKSQVINSAEMISKAAQYGPVSDFSELMPLAQANSGASINLSSSASAVESARQGISRQLQMMDSSTMSVQWATVDSDGKAVTDGVVLNQTKDGKVSFSHVQKGDSVLKDNETYTISGTVSGGLRGSVGLEALGTGGSAFGEGKISTGKEGSAANSVSYTDANDKTDVLSAGTSLANVKNIQGSYGTIDSHSISQAFSQAQTALQTDMRSLDRAASTTLESGASASIDANSFAHIGVDNYAGDAKSGYVQQFQEAIQAAGRYSPTVANEIQEALHSGGNAAGNVFNVLHSATSGGTAAEQMAATAALHAVYANSDSAGAGPYADMLERRMDVLKYSEQLHADAGQAVSSPLQASDAGRIGSYGNTLDTAPLNGIQERMADAKARAGQSELTVSEQQKIMDHNIQARRAATEELLQTEKALRERGASEKLTDNLFAAPAESLDQLASGDIKGFLQDNGMAAPFMGNLMGSQAGTGFEAGKNFSLDPAAQEQMDRRSAAIGQIGRSEDLILGNAGLAVPSQPVSGGTGQRDTGTPDAGDKTAFDQVTQQLMQKRDALMQKLQSYDPNDFTKTFDGTPVEKIIGRPMIPTNLDVSDIPKVLGEKLGLGGTAVATDREGIDHLARNQAFGGEKLNGIKTHGGTLAAAHAFEKMFDDSKHHDTRFSAFNDTFHVKSRPNSLHTQGLALDMVLDKEGKDTTGLAADNKNWAGRVEDIKSFMTANGFEFGDRKSGADYYVRFESAGDKGSTGNHIHFQWNSKEAADRFAGLAEAGQIKGIGSGFLAGQAGAVMDKVAGAVTGSGFAAEIKKLMVKGEGNYNSVNLGEAHGYRSSSRNLSQMTVNEIMAAQKRNEFNAVGKYQIIETTFAAGVKALGLKGGEKFTPELQERFFNDYLIRKAGDGAAWDYIQGKHNDLNKAVWAMAKEWASFPVPSNGKGYRQNVEAGQSYYHGYKGNKAHLSVNDVRAALVAAREG